MIVVQKAATTISASFLAVVLRMTWIANSFHRQNYLRFGFVESIFNEHVMERYK